MDHPSRPEEKVCASKTGSALEAKISEILRSCDRDKLARHLGLPHADFADALLEHPVAFARLAQNLCEDCSNLPSDDSVDLIQAMLGEGHVPS